GWGGTAGRGLRRRDVRVEAITMLLEGCDREPRAEPDRAGVGRQAAGQHVDQRGLAAAVRSDDADAVAATDAGRELRHDRAIVVALADAIGFDHQRARGLRRAGRDVYINGGGAVTCSSVAPRVL